MKDKKEVILGIRLTEEEMEKIEKIAKKLDMPKSQLARNLILISLEDAETYNKLGLFDIVKAIKELKEKLAKYGLKLQNA